MAGYKSKTLSDDYRRKIQATMLINRLTSFVNSEIEMSAHQVTAALGLLKKALPDLSSVQMGGHDGGDLIIRLAVDAVPNSAPDGN